MKFNEATRYKMKTWIFIALVSITFYFLLLRWNEAKGALNSLFGLVSPFIFGIFIAFLLDKPMLFIERGLKRIHFPQNIVRAVSAVSALILGIIIVMLFFLMIGPQILDSIRSLVEQTPTMLESFAQHLQVFLEKNNIRSEHINSFLNSDFIENTISRLAQTLSQTLPQVLVFGTRVTNTVLNLLVGLIAGLYIMLEKEMFIRAVKSVTYAFMRKEHADYLTRFANITSRVFNDFIIGKAIDSLIIGILTYFMMTIFKMPFAPLLSMIVALTNMIPVFGPFIGAIPGIFILIIFDVKTGFYFALLILAIQQFDGNILGPIILGDKLGLPSLAILFSVVVGGGFFGFIGMFIGVPTFAVFYIAIKEIVEERLKKKQIEI